MELIKTFDYKGFTVDLWLDRRAMDKMRTAYAATTRENGIARQPEGGWVLTQRDATQEAKDRINSARAAFRSLQHMGVVR